MRWPGLALPSLGGVTDPQATLRQRLAWARERVVRAPHVLFSPPAGPRPLPRLVIVLGSQRSGTNALRRSLSLDPLVRGFNEAETGPLYDQWRLRPEPEIRAFLREQGPTVLLKPIVNVTDRPVAEFLDDFSDYEQSVVWIYRDPVAVYGSRVKRWDYRRDVNVFVREWNRVNSSALESAGKRLVVVRYEDLVASRKVFLRLGRKLGVRGEYLFRPDESRAYEELPGETIDRIVQGTKRVLRSLDAARSVKPSRSELAKAAGAAVD